MKALSWNFQRIKDATNAAESANSAGYEEVCDEVLEKLANDILKDIKKENVNE